jgi:hypothetical protein
MANIGSTLGVLLASAVAAAVVTFDALLPDLDLAGFRR